jgi:hypothetical protein
MERAFKQCFDVQKKKVAAFMVGTDLKTGTLFGIMFKPWFHARIAQYGYSGGFRALKSGNEMALVKQKRTWIPFGTDNHGVCHHHIPKMAIHEFYNDDEIDENEYNVPLKPNYPAIDSLAPHRGEMYQCTAAQTHRIKTESLEALKPHFDKWRKANPNAKVKLIFVLPPNRFSSFTIQSYTESASKEKAEPFDRSWIEQWALEMDVSPLREAKLHKAKKSKIDKMLTSLGQ